MPVTQVTIDGNEAAAYGSQKYGYQETTYCQSSRNPAEPDIYCFEKPVTYT